MKKLSPVVDPPNFVCELYNCPICSTLYESDDDARRCAKSYPLSTQFPKLKVGDVITRPTKHTSWERREWVVNPEPVRRKFSLDAPKPRETEFYYVVGQIQRAYYVPQLWRDNRMAHEWEITLIGGALRPPHLPLYTGYIERRFLTYTRPDDQKSLAHLKELAKDFLGLRGQISAR